MKRKSGMYGKWHYVVDNGLVYIYCNGKHVVTIRDKR